MKFKVKNIWKKAGIWKKAFSISFAFHLVAVIVLGAMLAGFHDNVQKPQEKLINVDLANAEEADREEVNPQNTFSPINALKQAIQDNMDVSPASQPVVDPTITPEDEAKSEEKQDEPKTEESKAGADSKPAQGENNSSTATSTDGVLQSGGNSDKGNGGGGNGSAEGNSRGNGEGNSRGSSTTGNNSSNSGGGGGNSEKSGGGEVSGESVGSLAARFAAAVNANKQYPYAAIRLGQTGVVEVSVTLDASGNCLGASVVSGAGGNLNKAAINAVYASTPFPHKVGRTVTLTVPVHFNLN